MLISPLMGSLLAMAYGTVSNDAGLAGKHAVGLLIQIGISLTASTLYYALSPVKEPTAELMARTSPTFFDVIIAIAAVPQVSSAKHAETKPTISSPAWPSPQL